MNISARQLSQKNSTATVTRTCPSPLLREGGGGGGDSSKEGTFSAGRSIELPRLLILLTSLSKSQISCGRGEGRENKKGYGDIQASEGAQTKSERKQARCVQFVVTAAATVKSK